MCNTSHYINVDYSTPASYTFEKCEQFVIEVHEYWWATTNFGWNTNGEDDDDEDIEHENDQ